MFLTLFLVTILLSGGQGTPVRSRPEYQTDDYYTYEEIQNYLKGLAESYSNQVKLTNVGKSYENRNLTTITISNGDGRKDKKVIFIDAGFHAREWLTHTAALNIIDKLVVSFEENKHLLQDYDWVILPLVNPDGYTYSRSGNKFTNEIIDCLFAHTKDLAVKCWRKNREPNKHECTGTDLNRNFGHGWGKGDSSSDPCQPTYKGLSQFSASESQAVRRVLLDLANNGRGVLYLSVHSALGEIFYPWGSEEIKAENYKEHEEVVQAGIDAIANGNFQFPSTYKQGPSHSLYVSGGCSSDYAYEAGFPLSLILELPEERGNLTFGFHPPTNLIGELVEETWIGVRAIAEKVMDKY
ncbi:carboxypeptidase B-like [Drosophila santomea]|uniref:carboxypeptidase B-like n=1 Tax=Drosophila santomea TaxID=129105 RepID=UPI001CCCE58A|nr:carboxypeptidase B-like [Drosophila santomea]